MPPSQPTGERAAGALPHADIIVRVGPGRQDLAGKLITGGLTVSPFTGLTGLLAALDQALDTLRPPGPENGPGSYET